MSVKASTKAQLERWAHDFSWSIRNCPPGVLMDLLVEYSQQKGFGFTLEKPVTVLIRKHP
jgi:hypothetical protein